ncbi:hypothetical protein AX17_005145 [Amanita inopinata Kibby_2008]|nr:hypothetical protein AX17_005145 [Amanita inopinata Kibby_2008]
MANQEIKQCKAIYVVGPSSTGKTTLCTALAEILNVSDSAYVTEVARTVLRDKAYTREDVGKLQMQQDIMLAHIQKEYEARQKSQLILCDRSGIDPVVYAILFSVDEKTGQERGDKLIQMHELQFMLPFYRQSLFILLEPVEEWAVDDGVRMIENQKGCFQCFQDTLQRLGIEYHVLGKHAKSISARVALVVGMAGL